MLTITIEMKRGGKMVVGADGRCIRDTDGSGRPFDEVEDLRCYWPGHRFGKKPREIPGDLFNVEAAEDAYWDAAVEATHNPY